MPEDSGRKREKKEFSTLVRTIEDRLEDIDQETYDQPALFIQKLLRRSSDQYNALFKIARDMCEDSESLSHIEFGEEESEEEEKYHVFDILQGIQRDYVRIAELPFQHELYYFVKNILTNLKIESDVVVIPGNSAEVFVERSSKRYEPVIKTNLEYYTEMDKNHRIIEYQRTELKNPESYPLLIHELFHVFLDENKEKLNSIISKIEGQLSREESNYAAEILVDLLSVNYTGPVYAHTISKMPEKVGSHTDLVHANIGQREHYLLKYLEYIEERNASLPVTDIDVISQAMDTIGESDDDIEILDDFEDIQSSVEELMEELNIPAYHNIYDNIKLELGMPDASEKQIKNTLHELFLYSETDSNVNNGSLHQTSVSHIQTDSDNDPDPPKPNVAAPIRPVFLLNLLLEDDREASELYEPYLAAFKKWHVRKRTSEIRNKDIDQTPEHERHKNEDLGRF